LSDQDYEFTSGFSLGEEDDAQFESGFKTDEYEFKSGFSLNEEEEFKSGFSIDEADSIEQAQVVAPEEKPQTIGEKLSKWGEEAYEFLIEDPEQMSITELESDERFIELSEKAGLALGGMSAIEAFRARGANTTEAIQMAIESKVWSPEEAQAYFELKDMFDNAELEGFAEWRDAIFEYTYQGITDPISQVALLTSAFTGGTSVTARQLMMLTANKITQEQVKRNIALKGAAFGAIEAGAGSGAIDAAEQITDINVGAKEEFDFEQNLITTGTGTVLGGTLGWAGGRYLDSRAVDKFMETDEIVDDVVVKSSGKFQEIMNSPTVFEATQKARHVWAQWYGKPTGTLVKLSEHSPTAKKLMNSLSYDMARPLRGEREVAERTMGEAVNEITGHYAVNFKKAFDTLKDPLTNKVDDSVNDRLMYYLRGGELSFDGQFPDDAIKKAGDQIRENLNLMHGHAKALDIEVGFHENYVPRIWNRKVMEENREEFIDLLVESGQAKPKIDPETKTLVGARQVASKIYRDMLALASEGNGLRSGRPAFSAKRSLDEITDDNMFSKFLDNNVEEVMLDYIFDHGHKLGLVETLGVKNTEQFKTQWLNKIALELEASGIRPERGGLTTGEEELLTNAFGLASNEIQSRLGAAKPWIDGLMLGYQMSLLPLATLSSLSEAALLMLNATPKQALKGLGASIVAGSKTTAYNAVTGYNSMVAKANKKLGLDMVETLQVKHNMTQPEIWDTMARFNIATSRAAQDRVEGLTGHQMSSKTARKLQNGFFKVTALTDWTKFVEMSAYHVGHDIVQTNLKELAKDAAHAGAKPYMRAARRTRLLNELADLGISPEEGIEWVARGALKDDAYFKNIERAAARYTSGVILHPNRTNMLKPNIMNSPNTGLLFQLMSYPTAFSNVVLKKMARSMAGDDALVQNARTLGTISVMTALATLGNAIRTQGESLEKDPDEILKDSVMRWGGHGIIGDVAMRAKQNGDRYGVLGYGIGALGPFPSHVAKSLKYGSGPASVAGQMIPGYAAMDAIGGKGTRQAYDKWLRERDKDLRDDKGSRGAFAEGGIVDFPGLPSDPIERRNPYTGESYGDTADRIGFALGGLASKVSKTIVPHLRHLFRPDTPEVANMRALESLAGNPLKTEDLDKPVEISFMVSNKSTPKHRQQRKGTYDRGDVHRIIPLDSFEGDELMKKYGISEDQKLNFSHMVEVDNVQMAKGESPIKTDITKDEYDDIILYTRDEVLNTYNDGYRPLYAAKNLGPEAKEMWRTIDDADVYYDTAPQGKAAQENLKESMAASGPLNPEVFKILSSGKDLKYAKKLTLIDEKSAEFLNEHIRPVPDSIVRRVRETPKRLPKMSDVKQMEGAEYFNDVAFDSLSIKHKSRETVVLMSPDEFLDMARKLGDDTEFGKSTTKLVEHLDEGGKFDDVPFLKFENDGEGTAKVVGHEGRHRMNALKAKGVTKVPVRFISSEHGSGPGIRWSEQADPDSFDYVKTRPTKLLSEEGDKSIAFPDVFPTPEANPSKFMRGSKHKEKVFRATTNDKPTRELVNAGENPREIGIHVADDPVQAEAILYGDDVIRYVDNTTDRNLSPEARERMLAETDPEKMFGSVKKSVTLTPAESKYFDEIISSKPDYEELLEEVPSFTKGDNGELTLNYNDLESFDKYIEDTVRWRDSNLIQTKMPPSFYNFKIGKRLFESESIQTRGSAPAPSISDYYISIKNPLIVDVDMPSGWAAQDLIPDMLGRSEYRSRMYRPMEAAEAIYKNINYSTVFDAEDDEAIDLIQDYIITKMRDSDTSGLVSEMKNFNVNIDAVDAVIESYRVRVNKEMHPLMQAVEKQLNRPISDTELAKLSEIEVPKEAYSDSVKDKTLYEAAVYKVNRELQDWFKDFGFDSIEYNNTIEAAGVGSSRKSWILFSGNQLKSTRAESFDITDPRVSKAMGGLVRLRSKYSEGGRVEEDPSMYRRDGAKKSARGYLGPVENKVQGGTMTEVSVGIEIEGEEIEIPTMVPTLTPEEVEILSNMQLEGNAKNIPRSIIIKAKEHAMKRMKEGKSPFYQDGEDREGYMAGGMVEIPKPPMVEESGAADIVNPPLNQSTMQVPDAFEGSGLILNALKRKYR